MSLNLREGSFPVTETAARTILSLPMYPELRDDQIERVVDALRACAVDGTSVVAA